jgi:hypothetical protein
MRVFWSFLKKIDVKSGVDGIKGFNFVTEWHIWDKWFCNGRSGINKIYNGIQRIAPLLFSMEMVAGSLPLH